MNNNISFINNDILYYNCVSYGDSKSNYYSSLAEFEETRTQPFLINPQEYYMSIVRFSIDASSVPLFVCPVIENPTDPTDINYTPYVVTLMTNNETFSANLRYIPNDNVPLPKAPIGNKQDLSGDYYFVYYYSIFIRMINIAIEEAMIKLRAEYPEVGAVKSAYCQYDSTTSRISLVVPNIYYNDEYVYTVDYDYGGTNMPLYNPQPPGKIYILINNLLYAHLDGIEAFLLKNYLGGIQFLMCVTDNKNNYYYPPQNQPNIIADQTQTSFTNGDFTYTTEPEWFIFPQQYTHMNAWNSIASIVFLTQMPIKPEYIPSLGIINNSSALGSSSMPILTDFVPDITVAGEQRTRFNYIPTGQYRLTEINSTIPLNKIQFKIYWMDRYQNLYPMRISQGQINSVKIMFIKKTLYKPALLLNK